MNEPDLFNVDFYFSAESSAVFGAVTIGVRKIKKSAGMLSREFRSQILLTRSTLRWTTLSTASGKEGRKNFKIKKSSSLFLLAKGGRAKQ